MRKVGLPCGRGRERRARGTEFVGGTLHGTTVVLESSRVSSASRVRGCRRSAWMLPLLVERGARKLLMAAVFFFSTTKSYDPLLMTSVAGVQRGTWKAPTEVRYLVPLEVSRHDDSHLIVRALFSPLGLR